MAKIDQRMPIYTSYSVSTIFNIFYYYGNFVMLNEPICIYYY